MNLYFLKFKNYYSRELKYYNDLNSYKNYVVSAAQEVNFNPNDGVNAMQDQVIVDANCDYLLCTEYNTIGEENIVSRWYIIEASRQLGGYYKLTLRRDVLADYWSLLLDAPAFIEKATLSDDNPLIFNKEAVTLNQIKVSESLLKDNLETAWIIGYVKKDYPGATLSFSANPIADLDKSTWGLDSLLNKDVYNFSNQEEYSFDYRLLVDQIDTFYRFTCKAEENWTWRQIDAGEVRSKYLFTDLYRLTEPVIPKIITYLNQNFPHSKLHAEGIKAPYSKANGYSAGDYASVAAANGKTLKDGELYYSVSAPVTDVKKAPAISNDSTLFTMLEGIKTNFPFKVTERGASGTVWTTQVSLNATKLTITPIASGTYTVIIPAPEKRNHLNDAPFDMFCIPYDATSLEVRDKDQTYSPNWSKSQAISFAQGIAEKLSNQYLIDLQLLPYHPDPTNIKLESRPWGPTLKFIMQGDDSTFNLITKADKSAAGVITWATKSSGTKNLWNPITTTNKKLDQQTRFYRLCSPNWSGQFEFTPEKVSNSGRINYFNVDYTYLPYQPYIHVAPVFEDGSLYGKDYNDARGLICGGNFSISYLSDKWSEYQVTNKNYSAIFDRQIQNMEKTYDIQQRYWGLDLVAGALQTGATVGGIAAGATGPIGAAAIGMGTAAGSLVSGVLGHEQDKSLHNEAIDFAKDNYKMQLDNIKALPDSLTKVGVINENNKIYPVLEEYDCTTLEKKALANKIRYNGMTVGIISKIKDYTINSWEATIDGETIKDKGFIKGYFIQIPKLGEDYHLTSALSEELNKGIYLKED